MQVNIISFGQIKEITGSSALTLHDMHDTDQVKQRLQEQYPALEKLPFILAVDKNIISGNTKLKGDVTIAVLPPFSGG